MESLGFCVHPTASFLSPPSLVVLKGLQAILKSSFVKGRISTQKSTRAWTGVSQANSTATHKGLCKIHWTVEANLPAGQMLYLTGDPDVLGSWETEMAVLMSPTEQMSVWKVEVEMASGVAFKYNYFIKEDSQRLCDIMWKPGPQFSLSVPILGRQDAEIVLRDSWMQLDTLKPQVHLWGSWIEEVCLPAQSLVPTLVRDEDEMLKSQGSDLLMSETTLKDLIVKDESCSKYDDILSVFIKDSDSKSMVCERNQPVEEPWLLQSFLLHIASKNEEALSVFQTKTNLLDEVTEEEVNDPHHQIAEELLPDAANKLNSLMDSVSVDILINSSICTMQRIAVLEDAKLVELLLEPVKSDVLCDSVYLGVVTKLVPHMGGAFVNIGSSRPSLMDIKENREPFIFSPFNKNLEQQNNESMFGGLGEYQISNESQHYSHTIIDDLSEVEFQDDHVQFMYDDDEDHEPDGDFDVPEVVSENVNGSIVNREKVDCEDCLGETKNHLVGENINTPRPFKDNFSHDSPPCHFQDMNDSKQGCIHENKWARVQKGTKIVVQVVKEGLGTKGPTLTASPKLRSRFWVLITRCNRVGVSKKITGVERTRLKVIAKTLQPKGFGLTVRTVAAGHSLEELQKDLEGLLSTWKNIMEHAKSASLAADEGVEGAIPVILHRAMGQTLSIVQDYFNEKVNSMIVDSPRTYHEVNNYLQEIAPDLCDRVQLYDRRVPLFDKFKIEEVINGILSKRVPLANGGSLVIEQTEALVSIDVNGGHGMLGEGTSQEKAILEVNLAAAKQIARELRLRDIGGIIVVDFIDMVDEANKRLIYEEVKKAVERDRSMVKVSELSRHGLMEITRKRVRPSVTFMISEPCACCHATGRVEALETSFAKIEQEICRLLAKMDQKADSENPKSWPKFILRVDRYMCNYLTAGKRTRLAILSSSLKVWILLKVARGFTRGAFEMKPFTDDKANNTQHHVHIPLLRPSDTGTFNPSQKITLVPVKKWRTTRK